MRALVAGRLAQLPIPRVRISTTDRKARSAIHEFLRYQIREHATGDPLSVPAR